MGPDILNRGSHIIEFIKCVKEKIIKCKILWHILLLFSNKFNKGSLTVWALYAYFSELQNAAFGLLVWCM